jgi:hypothetical protein
MIVPSFPVGAPKPGNTAKNAEYSTYKYTKKATQKQSAISQKHEKLPIFHKSFSISSSSCAAGRPVQRKHAFAANSG